MVTIHPQPGKAKSHEILSAFQEGYRLVDGFYEAQRGVKVRGRAYAFYGCVGIEADFAHARATADWYYGDNSYFDQSRGTFYRFSRNAFQPTETQSPDWGRYKSQGVEVNPWRKGRHVVFVEQSAHFLSLSGGGAYWLTEAMKAVRAYTDRPFIVRPWRRDKAKAAKTLGRDLEDAWALVTHMSAAAVEGLLAGVPVFVTGPCAASPMGCSDLSRIESPRYPDGRLEWAAGLANSHWTLAELRGGIAWRRLAGSTELEA
jgi:hypothetical protein